MCSNTESFNTSEVHCLFILDLMYISGTELIHHRLHVVRCLDVRWSINGGVALLCVLLSLLSGNVQNPREISSDIIELTT